MGSGEWASAVKGAGVAEVATRLGMTVRSGRAGPCPACGKASDSSGRPVLNIGRAGGRGWLCNGCDASGTALDLLGWRVLGRKPEGGDREGWQRIAQEAERIGLAGADVDATPRARREEPVRVDPAEVRAMLRDTAPMESDPQGRKFCLDRGWQPEAVEVARYFRGMRWYGWWPASYAPYRLVVPMYDVMGELRGVHGRAVMDPGAWGNGNAKPKTINMRAKGATRGLVMASRTAIDMLRGKADPKVVIVAEGITDFVASCLAAPKKAIIGGVSGSFEALAQARIPADALVIIGTDNDHPDRNGKRKGEEYARKITRAVHPRRCVRLPIPIGEDLDDLHRRGELAGKIASAMQMGATRESPTESPAVVAELRAMVDAIVSAQGRADQGEALAAAYRADVPARLARIDRGQQGEIDAAIAQLRGVKGMARDADDFRKAVDRERRTVAVDQQHAPTRPDSDKPDIMVSHDIEEMRQDAVRALARLDDLYQRSGRMIVVGVEPIADRIGGIKVPDKSTMHIVEAGYLRALMSKSAEYLRMTKRGDVMEPVPTMPPPPVVAAVMEQPSWPFRPIQQIVDAPTLRPDGTIIDRDGYDEGTHILLKTSPGMEAVAVHHPPTRPMAIEALRDLESLLVDFPFQEPHHRSTAIAAILTMVVRPAIGGPTPMFLARANTAGTGKSLLMDLMSVVATGRMASRQLYEPDPAEMRKRITSILLGNARIVLIDNIDKTFGGAAWDAVLTARDWEDRELGRSQMTPKIPIRCTWLGTGNNVTFKGDLTRRVLPIDLFAVSANPEERTDFKHPNVLEYAMRKRAEFVSAALTIVYAYWHASSTVEHIPRMGSYEEWSRVVREPLVWLGAADPLAGQRTMRDDSDPDRELLIQLLGAWWAMYGGEPATVAQALQDAHIPRGEESPDENRIALRAALQAVAGNQVLERAQARIGSYIGRHKDRKFRVEKGAATLRFTRDGRSRGGASWRITRESATP